jgi:hypothetical protein
VGIDSVQVTVSTGFRWSVGNTLQGAAYNPIQNSGNITKTQNLGTANGNTQSGGADEVFSYQLGIAEGGSVTLNLEAMTNLLAQTDVAIARLKVLQFRVLSATDDPTISPPPNAASTGTVSNIGPTAPSPLDFANGGSGLTVALTVSGGAVTGVAIGAAGSGYPPSTAFLASPQQAGGHSCVFLVIVNGSGVPTTLVFIAGAGGAGYTAATVPAISVGQYTILTGGAHMYVDPAAAGFALVSATQQNVELYNNDPANAITFEIDFVACST